MSSHMHGNTIHGTSGYNVYHQSLPAEIVIGPKVTLDDPTTSTDQVIEDLRVALYYQWLVGHAEHCGIDGDHVHRRSGRCDWPLPRCLDDLTDDERTTLGVLLSVAHAEGRIP